MKYLLQKPFVIAATAFVLLLCSVVIVLQADDNEAESTVSRPVATAAPDHEIKYNNDRSPEWKENWDLARQLYREKKYREALVQYELLLAQKESIDEARWEYVSILLRLKRWQQAGKEMERLLATEPDNTKYLFAQARVKLETGKLDQAITLYKQLYNKKLEGQDAIRALEGIARVFELQGNEEALLPLLEQLLAQKPDDIELQKKLALLAMKIDRYDKAEGVLRKLEQELPDDVYVIQALATLQEKKGNTDGAAAEWQKLVSIDPNDMEAHDRLQGYYRNNHNWSMSLKHVELMLKVTPTDAKLLENAADLNMKLGRVDKALEYYDYLLAIRPGNKTVLQNKKAAQKVLARDLLALVENDGSRKLWQDLVQVTADRPGVYREIANLLREKGKTDELVDVLVLIFYEDPDDEETVRELTALLKEKGKEDILNILLLSRKNRIENTKKQ